MLISSVPELCRITVHVPEARPAQMHLRHAHVPHCKINYNSACRADS